MELDLKRLSDRDLLLIVATHVVEQKPEIKHKLLTESLAEQLGDSAASKLKDQRQLKAYISSGWKLVATIDYNDEKICTSSNYTDGDPLFGHQPGFVDEFLRQLDSAKKALAEKISSTYDLSLVGDVEAEIQLKPRTDYECFMTRI